MTRPRGGIIGVKPTWTTTATSGIWTLRQAEEMKADGKWPRGPVAPTSLAGTPGDGQVALTWVAPATTHGTITNYAVEYTPSGGSPTVVLTGSTAASYTVTGLTNDTEYTFRVRGINHTPGDWSDSVAVTPSAAPTDPDFASVTLLLHADGSDGSTTFADSSGSPKSVSAVGATISTAQSKFGGSSGRLNGSNNYLSLTHGTNFGTGDLTIETWAYGTYSGDSILFEFRSAQTLVAWGSGTSLYVYTPAGNAVRATLTANQWQHIAVCRQAGLFRVYLDGTQTATWSDGSSLNTAGNLYIGRFFDNAVSQNWYFDDYRISTVCRYPDGTAFTPPTEAFLDA